MSEQAEPKQVDPVESQIREHVNSGIRDTDRIVGMMIAGKTYDVNSSVEDLKELNRVCSTADRLVKAAIEGEKAAEANRVATLIHNPGNCTDWTQPGAMAPTAGQTRLSSRDIAANLGVTPHQPVHDPVFGAEYDWRAGSGLVLKK